MKHSPKTQTRNKILFSSTNFSDYFRGWLVSGATPSQLVFPTECDLPVSKQQFISDMVYFCILYTLLSQSELFPREIRVAFPKESQLQRSRAIQS